MANGFKRITPEQAFAKLNECSKGHLKIFLGYAPGVGKTFSALNEANRRLKRKQDILIGYLETHDRIDTANQLGNLQLIPRKIIEYNGINFEEMDTESIINRHPEVVLIDELAHTNVPGSKYHKRYEDVEEILNNGINVITTLNIQHLESLNDIIKQITGICVRETIPDKIVKDADEIVLVDITPDALQNRLKRGNIYKSEIIEKALKNFFRKGNLNALREIALRQTAEEVDEELDQYMKDHDINDVWYASEKVLVCITPSEYSKKLIRRGARIAKRYKCEWIVATVDCTNLFAPAFNEKSKKAIESHFKLATTLGAETIILKGKSVSSELTKLSRDRHITQIIIGRSNRSRLETILRGSTISKLLNQTKDIEIHIIPE